MWLTKVTPLAAAWSATSFAGPIPPMRPVSIWMKPTLPKSIRLKAMGDEWQPSPPAIFTFELRPASAA